MCLLDLEKAKMAAEDKLGFEIPGSVAGKVLDYAVRKCVANGKDADYLPILFENELRDYYTRLFITLKGVMACV